MINLIKKEIDRWYNEVRGYDFIKSTYIPGTGHFTQLVWNDSITFGVGYTYNTTTRVAIIVMNFAPRGNVLGFFNQNVFPK